MAGTTARDPTTTTPTGSEAGQAGDRRREQMRIRFMVLGALALLCAMAFYPSTQVAAKASYYYSFGQGLKPFSMGTDSPASLTTFERGTNSNGCFDNSNADGYANLKVSTRKSNALTWIGMDLPTMGNTTVRYSVS